MIPAAWTRPLGIGLLVAAAASYLVVPPGWPTIALAFAAWLVLRSDPALGTIPAAVAVVVALPYDRAADSALLRVAGIPVRPHDVVIGVALALSIPALRTIRWTTGSRLLAGFLVLGLAAAIWGVANDQAPRDILRDARAWGLYASGLVWAGTGRPISPLLRGAILGLGVFSALVVCMALLPAFADGLKGRALIFDGGVLRMHFGPTTFLLLPIAWWAWRVGRAERWTGPGAWLGLATLAVGVSLTRVTIVVAAGVVLLVALGVVFGGDRRARARRVVGIASATVAGIALALVVNATGIRVQEVAGTAVATPPASTAPALAASPTPPPATPAPTPIPQSPLVRFVPDLSYLVSTLQARFGGYANAVDVIAASPVVGHGLGQLVDVNYDFTVVDFDTPGKLPNVDNAYLTVGMKAGFVGVASFAALVVWPAWRLWHSSNRRARTILLPAWLGLLVLTVTQSFATTGHSPFVLGLLIVAIDRLPARPRRTEVARST